MNPISNAGDNETLHELVLRGARGDEKALEVIYHRFKVPLFSLVCRYTVDVTEAEDVLQDVFLTAFTRMGEIREVTKFKSWIFKIAVNASLCHLRSRKGERGQVSLNEIENSAIVPTDGGSRLDIRGPLEDAIQALPVRLRNVFLLHDVEGFKHEEIADILGCTAGTSKSQLFKARLKIRGRLTEGGIGGTVIPLKSQCHKVRTDTRGER